MNERKTPIPEPTILSVPCPLCRFPMDPARGGKLCYGCALEMRNWYFWNHPGANATVVFDDK